MKAAPSRYIIDDEILLATSDGRDLYVEADSQDQRVTLQASLSASDVVRLIDGTAMLETLLAEDRVTIKGDSDSLLRVAEIHIHFFGWRGAFAQLLTALRTLPRMGAWVSDAGGRAAWSLPYGAWRVASGRTCVPAYI